MLASIHAQVFSHWISDICLREEKEKEEVALLPGMRAQPPTGRDAFINAITVAAIQSTSTSMVTNAGLHSCIVARKSDIARATHGDSISHHEF